LIWIYTPPAVGRRLRDTKEEEKQEKTDGKASGGILPWIIVFFVVVLCGGAGFDFE